MAAENLVPIATKFRISGSIQNILPLGSGHIHDTYKVITTESQYVLQKFNHSVFTQPEKVAENIKAVAQHLKDKLVKSNVSDFWRNYLAPLRLLRNGGTLLAYQGAYWRMFPYIQHSYELQIIENSTQAYEVARTVARFQAMLSDLPVERLHTTLPDFHHLPKRYAQFQQALRNASPAREKMAKQAIFQLKSYRAFIQQDPVFQEEIFLPIRVTHNDTKVNNVLLDTTTHQGLCMIDLDTVMPGYVIHDFGDMVRTFCSPVDENSQELEKVLIRKPIFEALCKGYLEEASAFLTEREIAYLLHGGKQMILITATRFLTDFLAGDVYYKTQYEGHNLARAMNQLKLLEEVVIKEKKLQAIIFDYY